MGVTADATGQPQPWARPFVAALLAATLACGVIGIEAWPLSGFRLFSAPRGSVTTSWRLVALTTGGEEVPVNVSRLGAEYRGFGFVARSLDELSPPERAAVCTVWFRATASIGIEAAVLQLVRVDQPLVPRDDEGPLAEPGRSIVATCRGIPA